MAPIMLNLLAVTLALGLATRAQEAAAVESNVDADPQGLYCDRETSICFERVYEPSRDLSIAFVFPPYDSDEFIGLITAPRNTGWAAVSFDDPRVASPFILAWTNGNTPMISLRWATRFANPSVYSGARLSLLSTSGVNNTHARWLFRCQACVYWNGGDFNPWAANTLGWAISNAKPSNPAQADSPIARQDTQGTFDFDAGWAHSEYYDQYARDFANQQPPVVTVTVQPPRPTQVTVTVTNNPPRPPTSTSTALGPNATQVKFGQCGGRNWTGPTRCQAGLICRPLDEWYSQCVDPNDPVIVTVTVGPTTQPPRPTTPAQPTRTVTVTQSGPAGVPTLGPNDIQIPFGQCGGSGWGGPTRCPSGYFCYTVSQWYSQCIRPEDIPVEP